MVKGCQRKTIHIKDTGSKYYEEAYFILRPGVFEEGEKKDDMIGEALRIAGESMAGAGVKRTRKITVGAFAAFIIGVLAGAGAAVSAFCIALS